MGKETNKLLVVDDEKLNISILVELLKPEYKMMVAKKFRPPIMEDKPKVRKANRKSNWPELFITLSGGYAVQPESNPPIKGETSSKTPTGGIIQKLRAFTRGKATSSAPIMMGTK